MIAHICYRSMAFALVGIWLSINAEALSAGRAEVIAEGADDYKVYCGACHGPEGRGDGEMASSLVKPPTDLTGIAKPSGDFSFWRVYDIIAGEVPVPGHDTFQMPLYAKRLRADENKPGFLPAHIRVLLLTHYIESLQER